MDKFLFTPTTQILLGWEVSIFAWAIILLVSFEATSRVIDYKAQKKKLRKKRAERLVIDLDFWGAFVLATALGSVAGLSFGTPTDSIFRVPAVASLYNPMIGLYLLFISWKLKIMLHGKKIK